MARQQKYAKANSDLLKARMRRTRMPGEDSDAKFESAVDALKEVSSPSTRSKNWLPSGKS